VTLAFFLGGPLALSTGIGDKVLAPGFQPRFFWSCWSFLRSTSPRQGVYVHYCHDAEQYRRWHDRIVDHLSRTGLILLQRCVPICYRENVFRSGGRSGRLEEQIEALG